MKKSKGIVVLLLTLILTVFFCFTAAVGIGPTGTGAAKHINTGLDLAGGVSITYQAKESNPTCEVMSETINKLQKRLEQYSPEALVYQEGADRITVEIPGVTDADTILNDLGKPGSLYFITKEDADGNQNFTTGQDGYVLSRTMDEIKESGSVVLEGSDVADAQGGAIQNQNTSAKEYVVSLTLTSDGENSGKTKFAEATKNNVGKQIAIVYDNNIISAPNVNEEISGGKAQISGMSDLEEAQNLASYIRIGSLGLELEELRSSVVAAQLGEEAISTSVLAGAIGLIFVITMQVISVPVVGLSTTDAEVARLGGQYIRGYIWDCIFAGVHFTFSGYFCACGRSEFSFLHNIIAILLVRIPGVYLTSIWFPDTLFPMGIATACGSLTSLIICLLVFRYLKKKPIRTAA